MPDDRVDIEALLRHRPFVRRLARSLVRDQATADDVVQETWVAALQNPPRHRGALRAWLASVVRKVAWTRTRSERRRANRERKAAVREGVPASLDVLERARWHRRLVDAVMALPEPYRTTILLRYFEDLSSGDIGRLQGVPAATVRTRLKRGLERLREGLDGAVPGGRKKWLLGLAALALPSREAQAAAAVSRARWTAAAVATALVGAIVGVVALLPGSGPPPSRATPAAAAPRATEERVARSGPEAAEAPVADGALEVTVLADGRPAAGARVVLARKEAHAWRHTPYDVWRAEREVVTDAAGRARFADPGPGYARVLAALPGHGRAEGVAHLPQALPHAVVLELAREAPVEVVVTELGTGRPLGGAHVEVLERYAGAWLPEAAPAPTDGAGRTLLRGLPDGGSFRLRVTRPGHAAWGPRPARAGGALTVELEPRARTVAWPAAGAAPADGTVLALRRVHEAVAEREAVVEGRAVVARGLGPGVVPELLALAPDGSFARLEADAGVAVGAPVAFEEPARLEVSVHDADGGPVAGAIVRVSDPITLTAFHPEGRTDAAGLARLPVYARTEVVVQVRERRDERPAAVGRFDPATRAGRLEVTRPRARDVVLRLSQAPGLFELYAGRERVEAERAGRILRFAVRPGADGTVVHLLAQGFVPVTLPVAPGAETFEREVELVPAGALVLHVLLRDESQPFQLQLVDADRGEPPWRGPWRFRLYPGPDRVVRETMVAPGRYRVRDAVSGRATEDFRVLPGTAGVRLYLDLLDAGPPPPPLVRGRVSGFADLDLSRASVTVEARGGGFFDVAEVARDGTFAFPWPGSGPLVVYATHPDVPVSAAATLTAPRDDLRLALTPTYRVALRVTPPPEPRLGGTAPRVVLFPVAGGPHAADAVLEGDLLRFGGVRPGVYRVWLDLPGFAPERLGPVPLDAERNDLGAIALRRGATLRLRILAAEASPPPDLTVAAQALDEPRYQRSASTGGDASASLPGLGPGRFQVTAWDRVSGQRVWSERIEIDGDADRALDVDLR